MHRSQAIDNAHRHSELSKDLQVNTYGQIVLTTSGNPIETRDFSIEFSVSWCMYLEY